MSIKENIEAIRAELEAELEKAENGKLVEELRQKVLGRKGTLTALRRMLGGLSAEERPAMGQLINEGCEKIGALLDARLEKLQALERE